MRTGKTDLIMNKKYTFLITGALLLCSFFLSSTFSYAQQANTEDLLKEAFKISEKNNPAHAKIAFDQVLQQPDLTPRQRYAVYRELVRVYNLRNQRKNAIEAMEQALQVTELSAEEQIENTLELADALLKDRQPDRVTEVCQQLLDRSDLGTAEQVQAKFMIASATNLKRLWKETEEQSSELLIHPDLTTEQRFELLVQLGNAILNQNNNQTVTDAEQAFRKATLLPDISAKQRYDSVVLLGKAIERLQRPRGTFASTVDNVYFDKWLDMAIEDYRSALQTEDLTNQQKIHLHQLIAEEFLNKMDIDSANRVLQEATQLDGLNTNDLILARSNQARVFTRQLEPEKAKAIYDEILTSDKMGTDQRVIHQIVTERALLEDSIEDQIRFVQQHEPKAITGLASRYRYINNPNTLQSKIQINRIILADQNIDIRTRHAAYTELIRSLASSNDYAELDKTYRQYADDFYSANETLTHFSPFAGGAFKRLHGGRSQEFAAFIPLAEWFKKTFSDEQIPDSDKADFYGYIINAATQQNDYATVREYTRKIIDQATGLAPDQRLRWLATMEVLNGGNDADKVAASLHKLLKAKTDISAKDYANTLIEGGKFAMVMRNFEVAKRLLEERNKLLVEEPKRSLKLHFIENGPRDITSFLNSEYFRNHQHHGVLDRKYGDNLQFLMDTDTASTGRVMTTESGESISLDTGGSGGAGAGGKLTGSSTSKGEHTFFVASCDEEKVYFFFFMSCDPERAQKISEGSASIGSFEITLDEGYGNPYSCFIIRGPNNFSFEDSFTTQYNNRNYRTKRTADNNASAEYRVLPDGVALLISITWDAFVKLPQNGDKWFFEPIHWEKGGWTWGGSKSVHWHATQGELIFENLTPANLTAIKRRLLHKAKNHFLQETSARANGYIEIWKDNQLGDQDFYIAKVEDFHKQYLSYAQRIANSEKAGGTRLTDEEVNTIFDEAYDALINTRFIVAEKRYQYILEKYTTE